MSSPKNIGILIGSVRGGRVGPHVASFLKYTFEASITGSLPTPAQVPTFSLVDLKSFNLPVFDEAIIPAMVPAHGEFAHQHSKDWNAEISKYDAYVIVSPEYNYGPPGGLKNAIDYLYHAWVGKPTLIVSYGIFGGNAASDALSNSLKKIHLDVVETRPQLAFPGRDEKNQNSSPTLQAAIRGELTDAAKEAWGSGELREMLLKGLGELLEKLEAKEKSAAK